MAANDERPVSVGNARAMASKINALVSTLNPVKLYDGFPVSVQASFANFQLSESGGGSPR